MQNDSLPRVKCPSRLVRKLFGRTKSLFADNFTVFSNALLVTRINATIGNGFNNFYRSAFV